MSDFKFICPTCNQNLETDPSTSGHEIDCPGCHSRLVIPAPPKQPGETPAATLAEPKNSAGDASPQQATGQLDVSNPFETPYVAPSDVKTGAESAPATRPVRETKPAKSSDKKPSKPEPGKAEPASSTAKPASGKQLHIAQLTPTIKRQIVRSARRRIANKTHWMPRLTEEMEYAYAAKMEDGQLVRVDVTSPEATHFSILGAVTLELIERNVTRTASGRVEFLDHELLDALQSVAGEKAANETAAAGQLIQRGKQVPVVSHGQCLQALDLLEERYSREAEEAGALFGASLEEVRLSDLSRRLEKKKSVSVEEVVAALSNELKEINERLRDLER